MMTPSSTLRPSLSLGFEFGMALFHCFGHERKIPQYTLELMPFRGIKHRYFVAHALMDAPRMGRQRYLLGELFFRRDAGEQIFVGWTTRLVERYRTHPPLTGTSKAESLNWTFPH
jgi:hypothetical protein